MDLTGIRSSPSNFGEFFALAEDNSIPMSFDTFELGPIKHTNYLKRELFHMFGIQMPQLENITSREKDLALALSKLFDKAAILLKQNQGCEQSKSRMEEEIQKLTQELKQTSSEFEALKRAKKESDQKLQTTIKGLQNEIKIKTTRIGELEKEMLIKEKENNFILQSKLNPQIKGNFIIPSKIRPQEKKASIDMNELFRENLQKQIKEYKTINEMLFGSIVALSEALREACSTRRSFLKETYETKSEKPEVIENIEKTFKLISTSSKSTTVDMESSKKLLDTVHHFISFVESFDSFVCPAYGNFNKVSHRKGSGVVDLDSVYRSRKLTTVRQVKDMQNLLEELSVMAEEHKSLVETTHDFDKLGDTSLGNRSMDRFGSQKFSHEKKSSTSELMASYFQQQFSDFESLKQRYKEADDRLALELRGMTGLASDFTTN